MIYIDSRIKKRTYMILKKKSGQISVEFLTTYGWIFIIILLTIGILLNYGFLNPSRYLPERVDFGEQLRCEEFFLDSDALGENLISLNLRNNFAREINITNMYVQTNNQDYVDCKINESTLTIGNSNIIACTGFELNGNTKNSLNIIVTFKRNVAGAIPHNITGIVFAEAVEGEYCLTGGITETFIHCEDHVQNCAEKNIDIGVDC